MNNKVIIRKARQTGKTINSLATFAGMHDANKVWLALADQEKLPLIDVYRYRKQIEAEIERWEQFLRENRNWLFEE